ncbi:CHASE2 domain-containing protein [Haloferula sp. A504]|uniref:CHASE2 domain-containing protein n=1 Tax=Haloferula sp. A504 TaxID=3373601 RepID=UPI0031BE799E|nr:adenylate/guanylate cyclase domain-containing protein [Verrucomicrobiaceae bacterium E54]
MSKPRWNRRLKRLGATLLIGALASTMGVLLLDRGPGLGLQRLSYDLPFRFTESEPPDELVLVYLDEATYTDLDQPLSQPLDRRFHAELTKRLTAVGARTIVFDILFHDSRPEEDEPFARAIEAHGRVVLAGERMRSRGGSSDRDSLLLATPDLRRVAAGWGLTAVPRDSDDVIRRVLPVIETPFGPRPSLAEAVRRLETGDENPPSIAAPMLHHYGRAGTFPGYRLSDVLGGGTIPEDAFRDKIVIVGARQNAGGFDAGKDLFLTPYSAIPIEDPATGTRVLRLTPGVEIQATAMGNALEGSWIVRLDPGVEKWIVVLLPFAFAGLACLLPPIRGGLLCLLLATGVGVAGTLAQQMGGVQSAWAIPAFAQAPLVLVMALGAHYLIEYSARWKLRRAFRSYMSEEQARQIDEDEVSLELGGREVEATILFSDLEGFTAMSEGLPPQSVSKALISYFERATEGILDNDGTIIKYVGDAVMATWGAPLKVDREADRAIDAAIQMQRASARPITLETTGGKVEKVLGTRVGINRGPGLAGNLGSRRRFDYSVIGDTTNTAARLEGLNKMLGTSVLVSEAVLDACTEPDRFLTRRMGSFVLKGKKQGIGVFEVMGERGDAAQAFRQRQEAYLIAYQEGLGAFESGDLMAAREAFLEAKLLHDFFPEDPASRLFLDAIESLGSEVPKEQAWRGEVVLSSK